MTTRRGFLKVLGFGVMGAAALPAITPAAPAPEELLPFNFNLSAEADDHHQLPPHISDLIEEINEKPSQL